jgi:DnaJ-class molecular chaperone
MGSVYPVLGICPPSTPAEIKKAYRDGCKKHHPDHGGDSQIFMELQAEYKQAICHSTEGV